ncbi:photosynthetic complex assembly protein PuhC [Afifella sp. H1R]|uniref:photosynthetic complex assembly protein PuhC n=1 Tax=unclassified Afifella TaxID=2624128 RepID=UPI001EEE6051|nr:photosynthetic complex assembly protein [Afifella sp. H1R]
MSGFTNTAPFPRGPLLAVAALLTVSIVLAAVSAFDRRDHSTAMPGTTAVEVRLLQFKDLANGGVGIFDASDGSQIAVAAPGTNGFLRATLRGLAHERERRGISPDSPFRLTYWDDGQLSLEDPSTGRLVALEAFGPTNAQVFARFLSKTRQAQ